MSKNSPKIVAIDARVNRFLLISIILTGLFGLILFAAPAHAVTLPNECPGSLADYNVIEGTENDDTLVGTSGQDYIIGKGGNDTINGGGGNDCIQADGGSDNITTGSGSDVILVGGSNNVINAGDGNNVVISGSGRDNITTGNGDDTIVAGDGNNSIRAGGGNDTITAGSGNDYINGGDGSDSCSAGGGKNIIQKCESVDETPSENPQSPGEEIQPGPVDENSGGGDDSANTNPTEDPSDEESSEGNEENNDQEQPTVGNGIVLNSGGGVPPIEIREENLSNINKNLIRLTWKTNIPATSQVIYDIISHPELGNPPLYGYAFSTVEVQYLTTTHSVEVGGLDPEKSYYIRPVSDVSNSTEGVGIEIVVEGAVLAEETESEPEDVAAGLLADEALTLASASGDISINEASPGQGETSQNTIERTDENNGALAVNEPGALAPDDEAKLALAASATSFGGSQIFLMMIAVIVFAIMFMVAGKRDENDDQEVGNRN